VPQALCVNLVPSGWHDNMCVLVFASLKENFLFIGQWRPRKALAAGHTRWSDVVGRPVSPPDSAGRGDEMVVMTATEVANHHLQNECDELSWAHLRQSSTVVLRLEASLGALCFGWRR